MVTYIFGIEFKEVWYYVLMASSASWFSICSILFHFFVPFSGLLLRRRKWASLYGKTVILILKCNEKEPFRGFLNHSVRQPTTNMLSLNPSGTVHYHFIDSLVYYYGRLCYIYLSFWKLQFVINNARRLKHKVLWKHYYFCKEDKCTLGLIEDAYYYCVHYCVISQNYRNEYAGLQVSGQVSHF